ncbi:hypothetical protein D3C72_1787380 [compost metagenome]
MVAGHQAPRLIAPPPRTAGADECAVVVEAIARVQADLSGVHAKAATGDGGAADPARRRKRADGHVVRADPDVVKARALFQRALDIAGANPAVAGAEKACQEVVGPGLAGVDQVGLYLRIVRVRDG